MPPVNFNLRDCVNRWKADNMSAISETLTDTNDVEGLRILRLFFRRI